MYVDDFEVTKREIISSVVIVLLMLCLGFFISTGIANRTAEKNEVFYKAVKINDNPDEFAYGMDTNIGNALIFGTVKATNPVSVPELVGEYYSVKKVTERYTMHIRTVTTTDSKGKTHTRTETYYTWDVVDSDTFKTDIIEFLGKTFNVDKIQISYGHMEDMTNETVSTEFHDWIRGLYLYEDGRFWNNVGDKRYYFYVVPTEIKGTIFANLKDGDMEVNKPLYCDETTADVIADIENSEDTPVIVFWIVWSLLIVGAVVGFVYLDNRWLED